jgi:hypothetical protein
MNGSQPFIYIRSCGCVFSLAGFKTVANVASRSPKSDGAEEKALELCPQCQKKYSPEDDIITLNPPEEEEERLHIVMEKRRLQEPPKKSKKRKNASPENEPPTKKRETSFQPVINSSTATSKVVASELAMEEARRKATMSEALKSLYGDGKSKRKETFMTMGTFTRVSKLNFPYEVVHEC